MNWMEGEKESGKGREREGEQGGEDKWRKRGVHRDVHFLAWELEGWRCHLLEQACGRSALAMPLRHLGSLTPPPDRVLYPQHGTTQPFRGTAAFLPMDSGNHCIRITWDAS